MEANVTLLHQFYDLAPIAARVNSTVLPPQKSNSSLLMPAASILMPHCMQHHLLTSSPLKIPFI